MKTGPLTRPPSTGFTLTEILVALLVAVFAIIPLLNLNTISRRRGQQGETYAIAQIEAERLVSHFTTNLGFDGLSEKLGPSSDGSYGETDPDVAAVVESSRFLDQAARNVKRTVSLARLEGGLIRVGARIEWQSIAPQQDLKFSLDRFVANQRVSVQGHPPFQNKAAPQGCP